MVIFSLLVVRVCVQGKQVQSISSLSCHWQCWCLHAAVWQGWVGVTAPWCLYSFAQSHTCPSTARGVLQPQFAPWTEVPGWGVPSSVGSPSLHLPCPLHSHGSSAGRSLPLGDHLPHQPHHEPAQLCPHGQGLGARLLPAGWAELPVPGWSLQAAAASPCQGLSDQRCLGSASSVCSTQGLGCHQPWVSQIRHSNNPKICWMQ